jgi:hypothetical protein
MRQNARSRGVHGRLLWLMRWLLLLLLRQVQRGRPVTRMRLSISDRVRLGLLGIMLVRVTASILWSEDSSGSGRIGRYCISKWGCCTRHHGTIACHYVHIRAMWVHLLRIMFRIMRKRCRCDSTNPVVCIWMDMRIGIWRDRHGWPNGSVRWTYVPLVDIIRIWRRWL